MINVLIIEYYIKYVVKELILPFSFMISGAILLILLGNGIAIFAYCLLAFNVATITIPAIAFNSLRLEKIESIKNNDGSVNIEFTDDEVIVKTSDASGNF